MAECFDCVLGAGSRERVNIRFTRKKDDYNKCPIVILRVNTPSKQFVREEYKRMEKYWKNVCLSSIKWIFLQQIFILKLQNEVGEIFANYYVLTIFISISEHSSIVESTMCLTMEN